MTRMLAVALVCVACGDAASNVPAPDAGAPDVIEEQTEDVSVHDAATTDASPPDGSTSTAYAFEGCPVFGPNGWFDTDVFGVAPDPSSAKYIQATVDAGDKGAFNVWMPANEKINTATSATSLLTVHPKVAWHSFPFQVPWASSFYIEPLSDAHALVVDTDTCHLYEFWNASYTSGTFSAYSGADWDMRKPFDPNEYDQGSTASGIPLAAIMVKAGELAAGTISHALGWGASASGSTSTVGATFVAPAHSSGGLAYGGPSTDTPMPYGSHIRLRATFDASAFPTAAKAVAVALQHYGAYLYDTGCCDAIPVVDDDTGSVASLWTSKDGAAIDMIHITDFDVIPPSAL